ncbi:MAG: hypothetical protein J0665_04690 [Deltaproteobacteria bacterium]|nr:hypothetical protein [Deltaproteobacteria bacterium]
MRFLKCYAVLLVIIMAQTIAGCGGGGGGGTPLPTTKTATLKFSSQSTNSGDLIGGFNLTVTLPSISAIQTEIKLDSEGAAVAVPLSSIVFLSGKFQNAAILTANTVAYNSITRELKINYPTTNSYELGEFITILVTVPSSYVPNPADINSNFEYEAFAPFDGISGGNPLEATATASFN